MSFPGADYSVTAIAETVEPIEGACPEPVEGISLLFAIA